MITRRCSWFLGPVVCVLVPSGAAAWTPIASSRPTWCEAVPYGLGTPSADLGAATTESEVRRGMEDWTRVACTGLTTRWNGRISGSRAGDADGVSMIGWVESGWTESSSAIGVTGPRWNYRNCIVEADMRMNGVHYTWTTSPGYGSRVNAYSIVLHEGGHYYGLGHSNDRNATMYFAYSGGVSSLNADDETGICTLYPGDGSPPSPECMRDTDCGSAALQCRDGSCVPRPGDGSVCSPCTDSSQCGGANDYCLQYPDGNGYCGKMCNGPADCGGDACVNVSGVGQCVRVVSGRPTCTEGEGGGGGAGGCRRDTDCAADQVCGATGRCEAAPPSLKGLGASCGGADECRSGLCVPGPDGSPFCSASCDGMAPGSCPSGFYCDGDATGTCGEGLCMPGGAGSGTMGASCERDTDCASLMCSGGVCASPCIPGGAAGCPEGFSCQQGATPGCGSCRRASGLGAACDGNDDCVTRMCAERSDGSTFCTDLCDGPADCPSTFRCEPAGGVSVCVPPEGGIVGLPCESGRDCPGGFCAADPATDESYCTRSCSRDGDCPDAFECVNVAGSDARVCGYAPDARRRGAGRDEGGCGCRIVRSPGEAFGLWPLLLVLWFAGRRRRRGAPRGVC